MSARDEPSNDSTVEPAVGHFRCPLPNSCLCFIVQGTPIWRAEPSELGRISGLARFGTIDNGALKRTSCESEVRRQVLEFARLKIEQLGGEREGSAGANHRRYPNG